MISASLSIPSDLQWRDNHYNSLRNPYRKKQKHHTRQTAPRVGHPVGAVVRQHCGTVTWVNDSTNCLRYQNLQVQRWQRLTIPGPGNPTLARSTASGRPLMKMFFSLAPLGAALSSWQWAPLTRQIRLMVSPPLPITSPTLELGMLSTSVLSRAPLARQLA